MKLEDLKKLCAVATLIQKLIAVAAAAKVLIDVDELEPWGCEATEAFNKLCVAYASLEME